ARASAGRRGEEQVGPAHPLPPPAGRGPGDGAGSHPGVRKRGASLVTALIFDCDGVLADTERYGHLPAFNATFEQFGLPAHWSAEEYGEKLRIGGGKERMASLFEDPAFANSVRGDRTELLRKWHTAK